MARSSPVALTEAAVTANGKSAAIPIPGGGAAAKFGIFIDVTVASGTAPTLDITLEYSLDGGTNWSTDQAGADTLAQITVLGESYEVFDAKAPLYRLDYMVTGTTPSFAFTLRHYAIG